MLVGRAAHVAAIRAAGLDVEGVCGGFNATPHAEERLGTRPELVLLTVKTPDIATALRENIAVLQDAPVLVLQNGLAADEIAASVVPAPQLVSGIVSMHAQYLVPGRVLLLQSEGLLIGRPNGSVDELVERIRNVLDRAVPTDVTANICGARWTKLIVNLNDVLAALTDRSFAQLYKDPVLRVLAVGLMREGLAVAQRCGIRLESLPGTSVPLVRLIGYLPDILAGAVAARRAVRVETHWPLKGSIWQSVARARPTEVEYLNGEVVRIGREVGVATPLNEGVMTLLRRVESDRRHMTAREIEHALSSQRADANVTRA